jgi:hypothetical protein
MIEKMSRWNLHKYSIASQMEYRRARKAEAQEMMAKSSQLANSFASISYQRAIEEGNLISKIAMSRMTGSKVSKRA